MGVSARPVDAASFAMDARSLLAAGVTSLGFADGSSIELREASERDTIPLPRSSETRMVVDTADTDISALPRIPESVDPPALDEPHPETMRDDEPVSDKIARENGWLQSHGMAILDQHGHAAVCCECGELAHTYGLPRWAIGAGSWAFQNGGPGMVPYCDEHAPFKFDQFKIEPLNVLRTHPAHTCTATATTNSLTPLPPCPACTEQFCGGARVLTGPQLVEHHVEHFKKAR